MEAVRRHPGPIETSRQFSREQDVGQLGFAIAAKAPIGALGAEIVERDVCSLMRLGLIVKGYGFGLVGSIVVGIIGAVLAGWLAGDGKHRFFGIL